MFPIALFYSIFPFLSEALKALKNAAFLEELYGLIFEQ
jgi:hypothetical protein